MTANVKNKSSMELENKIKYILMDFEINEITLQEATKRILLLLDVVGSDFEDLKDWGYEDENYPEEDDTLFAIESNFPPSNMTEKEWNDSRR